MSPPVPTSLVRVTPLIVRFKEGRGRWSVEQIKSSFLNVLCRDFAVFDVYTVDSLTLSLPRFRSLSLSFQREGRVICLPRSANAQTTMGSEGAKKKEEEKDNWRDWTVGSFWREERPNSAPRTAITDMGSHWGMGRRGKYEIWKKKWAIREW